MKSRFKQMSGTYRKEGDYCIPIIKQGKLRFCCEGKGLPSKNMQKDGQKQQNGWGLLQSKKDIC